MNGPGRGWLAFSAMPETGAFGASGE